MSKKSETETPLPIGSDALVLPLRVFEVEVKDWSEFTSICAARKPSAAKFMAWNSAQEAGFETVTFGRLRVRRAPEFDGIAEKLPRYPVDRTWALNLKSQQNANVEARQ